MKSFCIRGGGTEGAERGPASLPLFAKIIEQEPYHTVQTAP